MEEKDDRKNSIQKIKSELEKWRVEQPLKLNEDKNIITVLNALFDAHKNYEKLKDTSSHYLSEFHRPLYQILSAEIIERVGYVEDYVNEMMTNYEGGEFKEIDYEFPSYDIRFYKVLIEMYCTGVIIREEFIKQMVYERYRSLIEKIEGNEQKWGVN